MQLFWTLFSQNYIQTPTDQSNPFLTDLPEEQIEQPFNKYSLDYFPNNFLMNGQKQKNDYSLSNPEDNPNIQNQNQLSQSLYGLKEQTVKRQEPRLKNKYQLKGSRRIPPMENQYPLQPIQNQYKQPEKLEKSPLTNAVVEEICKRFHMAKAREEKFNIKATAELFNIHRTTLYRLVHKWEKEALYEQFLLKSQKYTRAPSKKGTVDRQTQQWERAIEVIITESPYLSLTQIRNVLKQRGFSYLPELGTIKRILNNMRYTKKRALKPKEEITINIEQNHCIRKRYCQLYLGMVNKPGLKILFLDQSKIDINNHSEYGWAKYRSTITKQIEEFYISLFVLLSTDGTYFWETVINITQEQINRQKAVERMLKAAANEYKNQNIIVVMNKIGVDTNTLKEMLAQLQWKHLIMPPSSPELNPAHYFYRQVKNKLKKVTPPLKTLTRIDEFLRGICPYIKQWKSMLQDIKSFASLGANNNKS